MVIKASFLSSSEQFSYRAELSELAKAGVSAEFVQSPWDCLWESSGGKLSWKMRNCSMKSDFFFFFCEVLPPTECRIGAERRNSFLLDVQ